MVWRMLARDQGTLRAAAPPRCMPSMGKPRYFTVCSVSRGYVFVRSSGVRVAERTRTVIVGELSRCGPFQRKGVCVPEKSVCSCRVSIDAFYAIIYWVESGSDVRTVACFWLEYRPGRVLSRCHSCGALRFRRWGVHEGGAGASWGLIVLRTTRIVEWTITTSKCSLW